MELENLKAKRKMLQSIVKAKELEIEKLGKQIQAIENGPVSAEEWVDKTYGVVEILAEYFKCFPIKYPPPYTYLKSHMLTSYKAGEQNERKRTQPLIVRLKEIFMAAIGQLEVEGYDATAAEFETEFEEALKTLEENEV